MNFKCDMHDETLVVADASKEEIRLQPCSGCFEHDFANVANRIRIAVKDLKQRQTAEAIAWVKCSLIDLANELDPEGAGRMTP